MKTPNFETYIYPAWFRRRPTARFFCTAAVGCDLSPARTENQKLGVRQHQQQQQQQPGTATTVHIIRGIIICQKYYSVVVAYEVGPDIGSLDQ